MSLMAMVMLTMILTPSEIPDTCWWKTDSPSNILVSHTTCAGQANTCYSCLLFVEIFVGKIKDIFVELFWSLCTFFLLQIVGAFSRQMF